MLEIKNISKKYITGDLHQTALNSVSLSFRDNEFVAILGQSGSGKSTMLNIIGGLDRYDSGDLIINGVSTKKYKDRDWDSYRNHTIGFVFQSYNLIQHQSVLANVELALTISGISKSERKKRAIEALENVGLGKHIHKKPNQLSGGQMQRVAIARALVNDPKILLADEPTGALDSETSIQVMNLLKKVAKDRLVIMVTHNPELATDYATRIVKVKDGNILDDSNPFKIDTNLVKPPSYENMGKASMSLLTALSLSFNNLKTKKGRTLLTSFAGSIGIIGIALILSLSNGVKDYISNIQKETMVSYPITIESETIDLSGFISVDSSSDMHKKESDHELDAVYSNNTPIEMASTMTNTYTKNNLTEFKKYLDNKDSEINKYIGENGVIYSYNTKFDVYTRDPKGILVNTNGSTLNSNNNISALIGGFDSATYPSNPSLSVSMPSSSSFTAKNFSEILPGKDDKLISDVITDNYDLLYGEWPDNLNELVLVLDKNNEISTNTLYQLGMLPSEEYEELIEKIEKGEEVKIENKSWSYEELCKKEFYLIPNCDMYLENNNGTFKSIKEDIIEVENLISDSIKLNVSAIVKLKDDADNTFINTPLAYTRALTDYIIDYTDNSKIVKAQKADKEINVLSGFNFSVSSDEEKVTEATKFLKSLDTPTKANTFKQIMYVSQLSNKNTSSQQGQYTQSNPSDEQLALMLDEYLKNPDNNMLIEIYDNYISSGTYDDNMSDFGVISLDAPASISIYTDTFENKESISDCIEDYNSTVDEEDQIVYTDFVGILLSSITTIIDVISYVLIAFVAVSLIVSSIMICIIMVISVMERTREIGVLRALGASKANIAQVFNAETLIIGFCSGVLGVGISLLLLNPINSVIHSLLKVDTVNAALPLSSGIVLIVLSIILTIAGGLIPARRASKKDPVAALRTE